MRYDLTDLEWSVIQPLVPNTLRGLTMAGAERQQRGQRGESY